MAKQIILRDDIDQQYTRFVDLNRSFNYSYTCINNELELIVSSYVRSGGKMNAILACQSQSKMLLNVCNTLDQGAELLRISKETMRNLDDTIRQQINNHELSSLEGLAFGDNGSDTRVLSKEEEEKLQELRNSLDEHYVNIYDENGNIRWPYSQYTAYGSYRWGDEADQMQCVGYAWARFQELTVSEDNPSGIAPGFSCGYAGNIGNSYSDKFEQVTDFLSMKLPALAYNEGFPGHVVVIEGIDIGPNGEQIVYYTEANMPGQSDGTLKSGTFDSFSGVIQLK